MTISSEAYFTCTVVISFGYFGHSAFPLQLWVPSAHSSMYKITMEQRLWYQFLLELLLLKSYFFWLLSHFFIKCAARDRGSWGNTSTVSANTANHAFQIMAIKRSYLSLTFLFKVCSVHYSFVACYHLLSSPSSSSTITIIIIIITIIIIIIISHHHHHLLLLYIRLTIKNLIGWEHSINSQ